MRTVNATHPLVAALLAVTSVCLFPTPAAAEGWSGTVGLAAVGQTADGNEDSFRSQTDLQSGLALDSLSLRWRGPEGKASTFRLDAWGFGAEPSGHVGFDLALDRPWRFNFDYDRRESFFKLTETELGLRSDDWALDRYRGRVSWDGWHAARLALDLRYYDRSGTIERPLFALNERYPLAIDLDETMRQATVSLETHTLPVKLLFEQSYAVYERQDRRHPAGSTNLEGDDVDLFVDALDSRDEKRTIPTSRLVATYGSRHVEVAGAVLWSPADLRSPGVVSETFDIAGGQVGRLELVDEIKASADMDTLAGNLRLGFRLAPRWVLRLEGDYHDTTTDAELLGRTLLRVVNPGGGFEIPGPVDETSLFDVTDTSGRLSLEWSDHGWTLWAGGSTATRDVEWRRTSDDPTVDVSRGRDGVLAGVSWSRGGVTGSAELEHGSFDDFVFRTDPETVDRLTLRLRSKLGSGWSLGAHGRFEQADNPPDQSDLDRSSDAYGLSLAWAAAGGTGGFGVDVDVLDISSDVVLLLPSGLPGLSRYDLSLLSTTAHGRYAVGKVRLSGSATRIEDNGDTWPLTSWMARARVGYDIHAGTELALFGEYWSYDEKRADGDDFDVTRYGLALSWRFE